MNPLVYALIGSLALSGLLAMLWVGAIDRNEALRRAHRNPPVTITPQLPRSIIVATARRRSPRSTPR